MANITYTDKDGEHKGTLTLAEYFMYGFGCSEEEGRQAASYCRRGWDDTDTIPFDRAVSKKYNTQVLSCMVTRR